MADVDKDGKSFVEFQSYSPDKKLDYLYMEIMNVRGTMEKEMAKFNNRLKILNISTWIAIAVFTLNFVRSFFSFATVTGGQG